MFAYFAVYISYMARHYKRYSDEDIRQIAAKVFSLSALLRSLNLVLAGGNYDNMRRKLQKLNIDTSHWTGRGWTKNKQLKDWSDYTGNNAIKKQLIKIREHKCECCSLTAWQNNPIAIELHHIDGDRTNNAINNLQLLCPNCHSLTNTFRGKNIQYGKTEYYCKDCHAVISSQGIRCVDCANKKKRISHQIKSK